ncbi:MAG: hypothetical protein JSS51_11370 [Planctomycetes bacterium]|nr:hypothetical protein [Planctomycetota bacterium]
MPSRFFFVLRAVASLAIACTVTLVGTGCRTYTAPVNVTGVELLEHSPTLAVDVENARGAVLLRVNPKIRVPVIQASAGTLRGEPVENYQSDKWVSAAITETDGRAVLTVRNLPSDGDHWVQMMIEVPSCDGIRVKNSDGTVDLRDINGAISVENGGAGKPGGYVYVQPAKPTTSPISITTSQGDVDLILPTGSTGNIELISGNNALAAIVAWTGQVNNSAIRPGVYTGILNWGTNPIRVKSAEGEVRLRVGPYRFGNPQVKYYKNWYFS